MVSFEQISEAQNYFANQSTTLSKDRIRVRGIVLDMSLPSEAVEKTARDRVVSEKRQTEKKRRKR